MKIRNYIEKIDNHNAASTMGTIDFLDATSKFYLTELPCIVPKDDHNKALSTGVERKEWYTWEEAIEEPK